MIYTNLQRLATFAIYLLFISNLLYFIFNELGQHLSITNFEITYLTTQNLTIYASTPNGLFTYHCWCSVHQVEPPNIIIHRHLYAIALLCSGTLYQRHIYVRFPSNLKWLTHIYVRLPSNLKWLTELRSTPRCVFCAVVYLRIPSMYRRLKSTLLIQ